MTRLYGIKNCDTVKKARRWLESNGVAYEFHDFRADGLSSEQADDWLRELGAKTLVNTRSTTWKQLSDADKQRASSTEAAGLLVEHPTLIKRPLLDTGSRLHCGFKDADYAEIFGG